MRHHLLLYPSNSELELMYQRQLNLLPAYRPVQIWNTNSDKLGPFPMLNCAGVAYSPGSSAAEVPNRYNNLSHPFCCVQPCRDPLSSILLSPHQLLRFSSTTIINLQYMLLACACDAVALMVANNPSNSADVPAALPMQRSDSV